MRKLIVVAILIQLSGCSIFSVMDQPGKIPVTAYQPPADRVTISILLGAPIVSHVEDGTLTETFKFRDGYSSMAKTRAIPYFVACLFTLCLSELIIWPIESLYVTGSDRIYTVTYSENGRTSIHGVLVGDDEVLGEFKYD